MTGFSDDVVARLKSFAATLQPAVSEFASFKKEADSLVQSLGFTEFDVRLLGDVIECENAANVDELLHLVRVWVERERVRQMIQLNLKATKAEPLMITISEIVECFRTEQGTGLQRDGIEKRLKKSKVAFDKQGTKRCLLSDAKRALSEGRGRKLYFRPDLFFRDT